MPRARGKARKALAKGASQPVSSGSEALNYAGSPAVRGDKTGGGNGSIGNNQDKPFTCTPKIGSNSIPAFFNPSSNASLLETIADLKARIEEYVHSKKCELILGIAEYKVTGNRSAAVDYFLSGRRFDLDQALTQVHVETATAPANATDTQTEIGNGTGIGTVTGHSDTADNLKARNQSLMFEIGKMMKDYDKLKEKYNEALKELDYRDKALAEFEQA
ncbi:hypothetical protein BDW71DRAFT_177174 [Aspergillus fruticulosus]